ncbi:Rieske (2Fe-2S) protein [Chloroflexota bacterium]
MGEFIAAGREILLARIGDRYYAAQNRCPHMGGDLSHGRLDGTVVTCPRHGSQFDLTDGRVMRWLGASGVISKVGRLLKSPRPLVVYNVEIKDGRVMVEV